MSHAIRRALAGVAIAGLVAVMTPGASSTAQTGSTYLTGGAIQLDGTVLVPAIPCTHANGCDRTGGSFVGGTATGEISGVDRGAAFSVEFRNLQVNLSGFWNSYYEREKIDFVPLEVDHCGFFGATETFGPDSVTTTASSTVSGRYGTSAVTGISMRVWVNFVNTGNTTHVPFSLWDFTLTLSNGTQVLIDPTSDLAGGIVNSFRGRGTWVEQGGFVPTLGAPCSSVHPDLAFDVSVLVKSPQMWLYPGL